MRCPVAATLSRTPHPSTPFPKFYYSRFTFDLPVPLLLSLQLNSHIYHFMKQRFYLEIPCVLLLLACCLPVRAQDSEPSLGDVARSLRKEKPKPATQQPVIDNDNFTQMLTEAESRKLSSGMLFSFDAAGRSFSVSSPDVTCNLSFNANSTALLSNPFAAEDLPETELAKLDGPATIQGDSLQLSVYNGSAWSLKEITVGLTLVRHATLTSQYSGNAKLLPASAVETSVSEKRSDVTVLYHLKGTAPPSSTTVFRETIGMPPAPDQEWHWAIVQAKGIPPH